MNTTSRGVSVQIRPMSRTDLPKVCDIDRLTFEGGWGVLLVEGSIIEIPLSGQGLNVAPALGTTHCITSRAKAMIFATSARFMGSSGRKVLSRRPSTSVSPSMMPKKVAAAMACAWG